MENTRDKTVLWADNPLGILLQREAIQEAILEVRTRKKHRGIRKLAWWKELLSHYGMEEMGTERPAQKGGQAAPFLKTNALKQGEKTWTSKQ